MVMVMQGALFVRCPGHGRWVGALGQGLPALGLQMSRKLELGLQVYQLLSYGQACPFSTFGSYSGFMGHMAGSSQLLC